MGDLRVTEITIAEIDTWILGLQEGMISVSP